MKKIPTKQQIEEFEYILEDECKKVLTIGEDITNNQLLAIKNYGGFLALIPEDKLKNELFTFVGKIKDYNLKFENVKALIEPKNFTKERRELQKKAIKLRDSIIDPEKNLEKIYHPSKRQEDHYADFVELLDLYIADLDIREYHCMDYKVLPLIQFAKKQNITKTPIKLCIERILKTYAIKNYSKEAKKLIDRLDNIPE